LAAGSYLDILLDFTVYGLIPCGLAWASQSPTTLIIACFLLVTYFVNAAGLFYLSAVLEKNKAGAAQTSQLTSVTMPPALIEGTETVVAYFIFLHYPTCINYSMVIFALGVTITIIQRLIWAANNLDKNLANVTAPKKTI